MISYDSALELLKEYIKDSKVILHSEGVSNFASMLAGKIGSNHPELEINTEKVRIAALLHDIGKDHEEGHEERSLDILKKEGLKYLARISRHGFLYLKQIEEEKSTGSPEEVEKKIVAYSDLRFKFAPMTIEERLQEAKSGWKGSPEEIDSKVNYVASVVSKLEKELFELAEEEF